MIAQEQIANGETYTSTRKNVGPLRKKCVTRPGHPPRTQFIRRKTLTRTGQLPGGHFVCSGIVSRNWKAVRVDSFFFRWCAHIPASQPTPTSLCSGPMKSSTASPNETTPLMVPPTRTSTASSFRAAPYFLRAPWVRSPAVIQQNFQWSFGTTHTRAGN